MVDSGPVMYDYHYRLSKIVVKKVEQGGSEKLVSRHHTMR